MRPESFDTEKFSASHLESASSAGTEEWLRPSRRLKFKPDFSVPETVLEEAETLQFTPEEERALIWKLDLRIIPLVVTAYVLNQFDRTNIGNAKIAPHFLSDVGIGKDNRKWLAILSIFYVGYATLEIPANILQRRFGPPRFFFAILFWWGICSLCMLWVKSFASIMVVRFLIGIGEAGWYSGIIYYLSFWYTRREMSKRIAFCMTGTLPGTFGGLIAFGLTRINSPVLRGWQILFLVEAAPVIIMAFVLLFFLPSYPSHSPFLTPRERLIAMSRLQRDQKPQPAGGLGPWPSFKGLLREPNAYFFCLIYASFNVAVTTSQYFIPTIIAGLGFSNLNAQAMQTPPYICAWIFVYFMAWNSDRTGDRSMHLLVSMGMSTIGYIILASTYNNGAGYFGVFLLLAGNFSVFPVIGAWNSNNMAGTVRRGISIAAMVSAGNLIAIASPQIYFDTGDKYHKAHGIVAGCMAFAMILVFIQRMRLKRANAARDEIMANMSESEKAALQQGYEIPDEDVRFRFTL